MDATKPHADSKRLDYVLLRGVGLVYDEQKKGYQAFFYDGRYCAPARQTPRAALDELMKRHP